MSARNHDETAIVSRLPGAAEPLGERVDLDPARRRRPQLWIAIACGAALVVIPILVMTIRGGTERPTVPVAPAAPVAAPPQPPPAIVAPIAPDTAVAPVDPDAPGDEIVVGDDPPTPAKPAVAKKPAIPVAGKRTAPPPPATKPAPIAKKKLPR